MELSPRAAFATPDVATRAPTTSTVPRVFRMMSSGGHDGRLSAGSFDPRALSPVTSVRDPRELHLESVRLASTSGRALSQRGETQQPAGIPVPAGPFS